MKTIKGDLVKLAEQGYFDIVVHGCNCFGIMGAGIAIQLAKRWPQVLEADLIGDVDDNYNICIGDKRRLGRFTYTAPIMTKTRPFRVVNAYIQFKTSRTHRALNYEALYRVFVNIKDKFGDQDLKFGIPFIGCGLAGGNWNIVQSIIQETMKKEDVTVVIYNK